MSAGAANDEWIEWAGGECPVPAATLVDVTYRAEADMAKGERIEVSWPAGGLAWYHDGEDDDIIAYRAVAS